MLLFGIEVPDLLQGLEMGSIGEINSRDDIYLAFGKITHLCNKWEKKYKNYAKIKGADISDKSSLAHVHRKLEKTIDKKIYKDVEKVIEVRAFFEHEFLPFIFDNTDSSLNTEHFLEFDKINYQMNLCYNLICEAIDYVDNLLASLDLSGTYHAVRTTIFDKQN